MSEVVLLDAGPLGMVAHPRPNVAIADWLKGILAAGKKVVVPEIADYEVRRELLRARRLKSVRRLDRLKMTVGYLSLNTSMMLRAAELWAAARHTGIPTAADAALDADVILAAQAWALLDNRLDVVVATDNVGHISRFVPARRWDEIATT